MNYLRYLESQSIFVIREAYARYRNTGLLWSTGKDSTALLWICRKAFFGKIPFPVVHIDTSYKFKEIYEFRDRWAAEWGLDLIVIQNTEALSSGMNKERGVLNCCGALKTEGLKSVVEKYGFRALFLAIRRDEHGVRAKERYFSPRTEDFKWDYRHQPPELWDFYKQKVSQDRHLRIHPMLHWTELDIWRYTRSEKIPVVPLYFAKNGRRYRSIGCAPCTAPIESRAGDIHKIIKELESTREAERSGRAQDKENEYTMQKLRSLGYM